MLSFFFYPSVDGGLICSHSLSVVNNATMSVHIQRSYRHSDFISSGKKNLALGSLTHVDSLFRAEVLLNLSVMTGVPYVLVNYRTYLSALVTILLSNSHSC